MNTGRAKRVFDFPATGSASDFSLAQNALDAVRRYFLFPYARVRVGQHAQAEKARASSLVGQADAKEETLCLTSLRP